MKKKDELGIVGLYNSKILSDKIRPENVTYNSSTNNYSVTKRDFEDKNPLLCPWNDENCLYPLISTILYLGTKQWIHTSNFNLSPRLAQEKLNLIFTNKTIQNILDIPFPIFESMKKIVEVSNKYPSWELLSI